MFWSLMTILLLLEDMLIARSILMITCFLNINAVSNIIALMAGSYVMERIRDLQLTEHGYILEKNRPYTMV